MTNRREFLQTGVLVPLALNGVAPSRDAFAAARAARPVSLYKAIFDDRYAEGRAFAGAMTGLDVPVYALQNGDVTKFWFDELDLLWRRRPAAIAGTTQFGPMFVLERFANERGMRVALRVEHQVRSDGTLAHAMTGPVEALTLARDLCDRGGEWPVLMAALLSHCREGCLGPMSRTLVTQDARPELTPAAADAGGAPAQQSVIHYYASRSIQEGYAVPWDGPLFSWVIAPARPG